MDSFDMVCVEDYAIFEGYIDDEPTIEVQEGNS